MYEFFPQSGWVRSLISWAIRDGASRWAAFADARHLAIFSDTREKSCWA